MKKNHKKAVEFHCGDEVQFNIGRGKFVGCVDKIWSDGYLTVYSHCLGYAVTRHSSKLVKG